MKPSHLLGLTLVTLSLTACGGGSLLSSTNSPDETMVVDAPPLTIPPSFDLRPPLEGAAKVKAEQEETNGAEKAKALVLGKEKQASTPTENWLLKQAGAESRDTSIRSKLEEEQDAKDAAAEEKSWLTKTLNRDKDQDPDATEVSATTVTSDTEVK